MKITWQEIQAGLSIAGGIGGALGAWALLRTYWMSRPKLILTHKDDAGFNYVERRGQTDGLLITILVSNKSTHSNSILRYKVEAPLRGGGTQQLEVLQGTTAIKEGNQVVVEHDVNVVPLNVPAISTAEAFLDFLIQAPHFTNPLNATVTANDMHGNEYAVRCTISNPLATRF
jgi:hypothetical protein